MKWNTEWDDELRRLVAEGYNNRELTHHFGMDNAESLARRMKRLGIVRSEELKRKLMETAGKRGGNKVKQIYAGKKLQRTYIKTEKGCLVPEHLSPDNDGYYRVGIKGKARSLHRKLWIDVHGDIPEGMCIRHKCDNRKCCNVDHMELGTNDDNVRDRVSRNKYSILGSNNGRARITETEVSFIKYELELFDKGIHPGGFKYMKQLLIHLADKYKSSTPAISEIYYERNWKHVKSECPPDINISAA